MNSRIKIGLGALALFIAGEVYGRTSSRLKASRDLWNLKTRTDRKNGDSTWSEDLSSDITAWLMDKDDPRNSKEFLSEVIGRFSDELKKRLNESDDVIDIDVDVDVEEVQPPPSLN